MSVGPLKVYAYGELVGLLSKVEFAQDVTQPLPEVVLTFLQGYTPDRVHGQLKASLDAILTRMRKSLPWVKCVTPLEGDIP